MTRTLNNRGRKPIALPPYATVVVILSAVGLIVVVAPEPLVEPFGLVEIRQAADSLFCLTVLFLTAWGSWFLSAELAARHARRRFLKGLPGVFDKLSAFERTWIVTCLASPDLTIHRSACDSIAGALCELGFLTPPPSAPWDHLHLDVPYTMPADVADALGAHVHADCIQSLAPAPAPPASTEEGSVGSAARPRAKARPAAVAAVCGTERETRGWRPRRDSNSRPTA